MEGGTGDCLPMISRCPFHNVGLDLGTCGFVGLVVHDGMGAGGREEGKARGECVLVVVEG